MFPGQMSAEQINQFRQMDEAIRAAVDQAKAAGVPQGLVVSVLHAHAHKQTAEMVG